MSTVIANLSISLDGCVAGPDQSLENPIGVGGLALHEWAFATASWRAEHGQPGGAAGVDDEAAAARLLDIGAVVMGRNMFGPGRGEWDPQWHGWWGEDPPFHVPVFVLTHYPREPLHMEGGTTFTFITDGIIAAMEAARAVAGDARVSVGGGASTVRQCLAAGLLDELQLHLIPIILGTGERLFEGPLPGVRFEALSATASAAATHLSYRVVPAG